MSLFSATFSQPFTPRGVVAFARAGFGRLLAVQLLVAILASATTILFLYDQCLPGIDESVRHLPDLGEIRDGKLDWHGDSSKLLSEKRFLAFDVDLNHCGQIHSSADVQVEFGKNSIRISSLPGYADFQYPADWIVSFNRTDLQPMWDAWSAEILFLTAIATVLGLIASWMLLAALYFLPIWIFGFFTNRDLNLWSSWKFCGAALVPGALLMTAAIALYDLGAVDLIQFSFLFGIHFIVGWIYLFVSLIFVPRAVAKSEKENPFIKSSNY